MNDTRNLHRKFFFPAIPLLMSVGCISVEDAHLDDESVSPRQIDEEILVYEAIT